MAWMCTQTILWTPQASHFLFFFFFFSASDLAYGPMTRLSPSLVRLFPDTSALGIRPSPVSWILDSHSIRIDLQAPSPLPLFLSHFTTLDSKLCVSTLQQCFQCTLSHPLEGIPESGAGVAVVQDGPPLWRFSFLPKKREADARSRR